MTLEPIYVSNLMNPRVQTDFEDQNIRSACNIMYINDIGSVVIVMRNNKQIPVGIITERDIVRIIGKLDPALLETSLKDLMSKPLVTIEETATVSEATSLMNIKEIRRLVVVDKNNEMTGILTQKDIFDAIHGRPDLFSEIYGDSSTRFKEIYKTFNEYRLERLMPDLNHY